MVATMLRGAIVNVLSSLLSATAILALPLVPGAPRVGGPVLVLAAPHLGSSGLAEIVAQADGALVRGANLPWIMLARSDRADFAVRLRAAGAWLVLDVPGLAGCLPSRGPARPGDPT